MFIEHGSIFMVCYHGVVYDRMARMVRMPINFGFFQTRASFVNGYCSTFNGINERLLRLCSFASEEAPEDAPEDLSKDLPIDRRITLHLFYR